MANQLKIEISPFKLETIQGSMSNYTWGLEEHFYGLLFEARPVHFYPWKPNFIILTCNHSWKQNSLTFYLCDEYGVKGVNNSDLFCQP